MLYKAVHAEPGEAAGSTGSMPHSCRLTPQPLTCVGSTYGQEAGEARAAFAAAAAAPAPPAPLQANR